MGALAGHHGLLFGSQFSPFWGITSFALDGTNSAGSARYGWVFTVTGGADIACKKLRANTPATGNERVIIHRNSDDAVIAQADITTPGSDAWASASVTPFVLQNGVTYTISSRRPDGLSRLHRITNTVAFDSRLTSISGVNAAAGDARPTNSDTNGRRFCDFGA